MWMILKYLEVNMSLSSISNPALPANIANKQNSGTTVEQSVKRRVGPFSESEIAAFSDNVTLTESGNSPNSEKIAGFATLDTNSAGKVLKQIMKTIMTNSKTAVSAQANVAPTAAQTLLADI